MGKMAKAFELRKRWKRFRCQPVFLEICPDYGRVWTEEKARPSNRLAFFLAKMNIGPRERRFCVVILLVFLVGLAISANAEVLIHDEHIAAAKAVEFGRAAFVEQDFQDAYRLLSDETKANWSFSQMTEMIKKMHPYGFPLKIIAVEFEPMPGERSMNIFLRGSRKSEDFHYRLVMHGDAGAGYHISGFFRGTGPYPPSPMRMRLKNGGQNCSMEKILFKDYY